MTRRLILPAVLLLGLTACGSSTSDDESSPAATESLSPEQVTCESFYEGTGTPLAERAEAARTALTGGEVVDGATYTEVNALEQRITELGEDAPTEIAGLLEDVNAPFTETVAAYNAARAEADPETGDFPFPDLAQIDVAGSESAQAEVETACADAGYEG
ncbi:hypothetical protein AA0Y32_14355 [Georgenia phoenicis]|uniref:hypothetical protein n=1 Tax=unclassified Georgenia TaxID=2626815 RepID=UPI0039AEF91D